MKSGNESDAAGTSKRVSAGSERSACSGSSTAEMASSLGAANTRRREGLACVWAKRRLRSFKRLRMSKYRSWSGRQYGHVQLDKSRMCTGMLGRTINGAPTITTMDGSSYRELVSSSCSIMLGKRDRTYQGSGSCSRADARSDVEEVAEPSSSCSKKRQSQVDASKPSYQTLDDAEILIPSEPEDEEIAVAPFGQRYSDDLVDLEEGEIPQSPESRNLSNQMVPATTPTPVSGTLDNNVKGKIDDSNFQMEIHGKHPKTSELASGMMVDQVKADGTLNLQKTSENQDKPVGNLLVSNSELKVDELMYLEEGEIPQKSSENRDKPVGNLLVPNSDLKVDELMNLEEEEIPQKSSENRDKPVGNLLVSNSELKVDELVDLEKGEIPQKSSENQDEPVGNLLASNSELKVHELVDLEEGEIPQSLDSDNLSNQPMPVTVPTPVSRMLDNNVKGNTGGSNVQMEIHGEDPMTSQLSSAMMEDQAQADGTLDLRKTPEDQYTPVGNALVPDSEFKVDEIQDSEVGRIPAGSCGALPQSLPYLPKQDNCEVPQTVQSEVPDVTLSRKEVHSLPSIPEFIVIESDSEIERTEGLVSTSSLCAIAAHHDSSSHGVQDLITPSAPLQNQDQVRSMHLTDAVMRSSEAPETVATENQPMETSTQAIPTYHDSSSHGVQDFITSSAPLQSQDQVRSAHLTDAVMRPSEAPEIVATENQPMETSTQAVPTYHDNSSHGVQDLITPSAPVQNQDQVRSMHLTDAVMRPSEAPETVATVNEPMETSTQAIPTPRDPISSERANETEITAFTSIHRASPASVSAQTSSAMLERHNMTSHGNLSRVEQLPVSQNLPSGGHNEPITSMFPGIQRHQIYGRPESNQEAQVSWLPFMEQYRDLHRASVANSSMQPLTPVGEHGTQTGNLRSRADFTEIWSSASVLGSQEDRVSHTTLTPSQRACSDPLQIEMERIRKDFVRDAKIYQETMSSIDCGREREIQELNKKYDMLLQDARKAWLQKWEDHHKNYVKVFAHKLLANALTMKPGDDKAFLSPGARPANTNGFSNQSIRHPSYEPSQIPASTLEQCPPSLQIPSSLVINHSAAVCSPLMINYSAAGQPAAIRLPLEINHSAAICSPPVMDQLAAFGSFISTGLELQASAPQLPFSRSNLNISTSNFPVLQTGLWNQQLASGSAITASSSRVQQDHPSLTQLMPPSGGNGSTAWQGEGPLTAMHNWFWN